MACRVPVLASALLLAGCASIDAPTEPDAPAASVEIIDDPVPLVWEAVATQHDRERIDRLDEAWDAGLSQALDEGFRTAVREAGELLDPKAALPRAAMPPGPYQCRVVKLGAQARGPAFAAYKPFNCYVEAEGELLTMVKQTGSQRPAGRLWPQSDERLIFLGALALGDEEAAPAYGDDDERNVAGVLERVGPFRWRLVIPWPATESLIDVIELVPIAEPILPPG